MPRTEVWMRFFASAEHEIGILAYSALFLAGDASILDMIAEKPRRSQGPDHVRRPR